MNVQKLNNWSTEEAVVQLKKCCSSSTWAQAMTAQRPFKTEEELLKASQDTWFALGERDWLEAFLGHPKIGEKSQDKWAASEQSGLQGAKGDARQTLRDLNDGYVEKFGFIFIVCATGKSAEEMLAILNARLHNDRKTELRNAAVEQSKITALRLEKLL